MKILLVEDEKYISKPIEQILKRNQYSVDAVFDGEHGLDCGLTGTYDIIVLDIMLPKIDGITVLRELRASGIDTPVLMLTAKDQAKDKVHGLDTGADDYLAKPFDNDELLARLRALGRRKGGLNNDGILKFGNVQLNPHTLLLQCGDASEKLTLKESQLLELLIQRKGMITSKDLIIERLWGYNSDTEDSHVEYHMSFLRKKLSTVQSDVAINTIRGAGYILIEKLKEDERRNV